MAHPGRNVLRFTRIKLTNWRNFPVATMDLQKQAFIVGPNASGKSNLLDAIRFVSDIARPGSGGLQAALERRNGFSSIRCLQARRPSYVELDIIIGNDTETEQWRYQLRINKQRTERIATVVEESIRSNGQVIAERSRAPNDDQLEFSQTFLEQVGKSKDFRALTEFLGSCRYLHVVPHLVRDPQRSRSDSGEDPYGGDLLRRMKDVPKKTLIPRLRRIAEALRSAVPQFDGLELEDDREGAPHLMAAYKHWRPNASKQPETAFSDGTLRLIGLLWSIAERGGPLLLEEPELSLNDAVISQLPKMFMTMQRLSGRQVIATTHSSSLLDDQNVGLADVHIISVGDNGSSVSTLRESCRVTAQVESGMTISEAVLPLLRPRDIDLLGKLDVAGRG